MGGEERLRKEKERMKARKDEVDGSEVKRDGRRE